LSHVNADSILNDIQKKICRHMWGSTVPQIMDLFHHARHSFFIDISARLKRIDRFNPV
jgi:hypothetical protein